MVNKVQAEQSALDLASEFSTEKPVKKDFSFTDFVLFTNPFTAPFAITRTAIAKTKPAVISNFKSPFVSIQKKIDGSVKRATTTIRSQLTKFLIVATVLVIIGGFLFFFLKSFGGKVGANAGGKLL